MYVSDECFKENVNDTHTQADNNQVYWRCFIKFAVRTLIKWYCHTLNFVWSNHIILGQATRESLNTHKKNYYIY